MNTHTSQNNEQTAALTGAPKSTSRVILLVIAVFATAVVTALVTFSITIRTYFPDRTKNDSSFDILSQVIDEEGYEVPDYEAMRESALKAYVSASGDLYAEYYTDEEYEALRAEKNGHYVGIGVTVREKEVVCDGEPTSVLEILRIHQGSLVRTVGISRGDCIYSVFDGQAEYAVAEIGQEAAVDMIRGEEGTEVKITFLVSENGDYSKKTVTVTRASVETLSVEYKISETDPSVGIVRIYGFDLTTPDQLCNAIDRLSKNGIARLIFDMRDNGGGDLWSVVACASYFVNRDDVLLTVTTKEGVEEVIRATERSYGQEYAPCNVTVDDIGQYRGFETVVLVNEYTASAAELFTAVLRDYDLATTVGTKTYGKGSMQSYFSLSKYGMDGVLKITTNHYCPPCGEDYDGFGIMPDHVVETNEDFDLNDINCKEEADLQLLCGIQLFSKPIQ